MNSIRRIVNLRLKRCQTAGLITAVTAGLLWACTVCAEETPQTVAQLVKQIDAQLDELQKNTTSKSRSLITSAFSEEVNQLDDRSVMIFGERRQRWNDSRDRFHAAIARWVTAVDTDAVGCRTALADALKAWADIKSLYPEEALVVLPPFWSCPMHSEQMEPAAGTCRICGMSLEPIYVTQPLLSQTPLIRAEIIAKAPLQVGKKADLRIRLLFNSDNRPVRLEDLEEAHTRKIHLLISDLSETDYHHEHPEPVGEGEYAFSFIPALPGTYRVWADIKPVLTHIQQFSIADIPSTTPREGRLASYEAENRRAEIDGYRFDLSFDKAIILQKDTVLGTLRVTDRVGKPFTKLEVVMGAFGHFVGFREDFSTVLHTHPIGPPLLPADGLGGPDLRFYFQSNQPSLVRFFAQVKIGGKDYFPRFVIKVQPPPHLSSR